MVLNVFAIILGIASIYFFYDHNYAVAVILLVLALSRLLQINSQRLIRWFGEITRQSDMERNCNVSMMFTINIKEVLNHPTLGILFEKLKGRGIIQVDDKDKWIEALIENHQKESEENYEFKVVTFNIKNNLLWTNERIDFTDNIYYSFLIPYHHGEKHSLMDNAIEHKIEIRLLVVNGIVKLQIGKFSSKEYSPEILKDDPHFAIYKRYETITSFPLMYFSYVHNVPEKYLNICANATEWYKQYFYKKAKGSQLPTDWKDLNREIRDYNYVCSAHRYTDNKWNRIVEEFEKKKSESLVHEGFMDKKTRSEYDWDDYRGKNDIDYSNKYLQVYVSNFNSDRDRLERKVFPDYYEEEPL